ncbi:MAG: DegT/DnrJ/EryC1/StrS family aminotransferase [FCB group bacterium]|nr:DegT/DnrJ/EryC1/StrS family aminotransferase [FCB group bacterium]
MKVPLLDLTRQYRSLKKELDTAVLKVLEHEKFILGPEVNLLEQKIAELCQVDYACGVASGTDALLLALRAAGVQAGDEVITSDFSFFATAGVIARLGAIPIFVDIEKDSYNIDPRLVEHAITSKTKAIVPVHLFGQVADMDPILELAQKHNIKVVEDAAQAIGAEYKNRKAGSMGDFSCFSFYPSKNLGAGGDGGMIVTKEETDYETINMLRVHGAKPKYHHRLIGYNSRLATIQAAILLVKLPYLNRWSEKRREHARKYDEAFKNLSGVVTPTVKNYTSFHIFNQYTIAVPNREELMAKLKDAGIGFDIYYPIPFHKQECFAFLNYADDGFPIANKAAQEVLSLPIYPELTAEEQDAVIETIVKAVL